MTINTNNGSNKLIWIICSVLVLAGISLATHALLTFNKAKVIVQWTTASELNTIGFNLLRGETPTGPFEQVNLMLIPASSDSLTGSSYSYEDHSVQAGVTYFYLLEEIESAGNTNQHGPITVKANNSAKSELLIAGILIVGAIIYAVFFLRKPRIA